MSRLLRIIWCNLTHRRRWSRTPSGDWTIIRCGKCGDVWPEPR